MSRCDRWLVAFAAALRRRVARAARRRRQVRSASERAADAPAHRGRSRAAGARRSSIRWRSSTSSSSATSRTDRRASRWRGWPAARLVQSSDDASRAAAAARRRQLRPRRVQPPARSARAFRWAWRSSAALGAMLVGASIGGVAGYAGGALDDLLMRATDFVMVLPAMYVALALRSVLPLVLPAADRLSSARRHLRGRRRAVHRPRRARHRAIRAAARLRRRRAGAGRRAPRGCCCGICCRPRAASSPSRSRCCVPAFIVAEATLSYVGLGFPDPVASWGTMLHDASNVRAFADFPWLLSPAAAMFLVVLGLNLRVRSNWRQPPAPRR